MRLYVDSTSEVGEDGRPVYVVDAGQIYEGGHLEAEVKKAPAYGTGKEGKNEKLDEQEDVIGEQKDEIKGKGKEKGRMEVDEKIKVEKDAEDKEPGTEKKRKAKRKKNLKRKHRQKRQKIADGVGESECSNFDLIEGN